MHYACSGKALRSSLFERQKVIYKTSPRECAPRKITVKFYVSIRYGSTTVTSVTNPFPSTKLSYPHSSTRWTLICMLE